MAEQYADITGQRTDDIRYLNNIIFDRDGLNELLGKIRDYPVIDVEYIPEGTKDASHPTVDIQNTYTDESACIKITYGDKNNINGNLSAALLDEIKSIKELLKLIAGILSIRAKHESEKSEYYSLLRNLLSELNSSINAVLTYYLRKIHYNPNNNSSTDIYSGFSGSIYDIFYNNYTTEDALGNILRAIALRLVNADNESTKNSFVEYLKGPKTINIDIINSANRINTTKSTYCLISNGTGPVSISNGKVLSKINDNNVWLLPDNFTLNDTTNGGKIFSGTIKTNLIWYYKKQNGDVNSTDPDFIAAAEEYADNQINYIFGLYLASYNNTYNQLIELVNGDRVLTLVTKYYNLILNAANTLYEEIYLYLKDNKVTLLTYRKNNSTVTVNLLNGTTYKPLNNEIITAIDKGYLIDNAVESLLQTIDSKILTALQLKINNGTDIYGYKYVKVGSKIDFSVNNFNSTYGTVKDPNGVLRTGTFRVKIDGHTYEVGLKGFLDAQSTTDSAKNKTILIATPDTGTGSSIKLTAETINLNGSVQIGATGNKKDLYVSGDTNIGGDTVIEGGLTVKGASNFNSNLTVGGTASVKALKINGVSFDPSSIDLTKYGTKLSFDSTTSKLSLLNSANNLLGDSVTLSTKSNTAGSNNTTSKIYLIGATSLTTGEGYLLTYSLQNCYLDATSTSLAGLHATRVYNAIFNDYAEYRTTNNDVQPGQCVVDNDDGSLSITNLRLLPGVQVVSDTFGTSMGWTELTLTPLAVAGRVLVYTYLPRENYHAGMAVCSAPNGTIDIMTREEICLYPDCIIGIVSEIPTYDVWGTNNVKVDNRIWIKVR